MARKDIKELIEANLENIEQWTRDGLTMKQIASNLGVSDRTLYRYKSDSDSRLSQSIKSGRVVAVEELENTMFTSAKGFERKVKRYAKVKHIEYNENGKKSLEYEEMVEYEETVYYPPDTTAGIFLLKNWADYMNEPRAMAIRKKEVELREKQVNANIW